MSRADEIRKRLDVIGEERTRLGKELAEIEMAEARAAHPCKCVKLNRDIGIADCGAQHAAGRKGLQFGLVATTLSALEDCPECHGTGVPEGTVQA